MNEKNFTERLEALGNIVLSNPWFGVGGLERVYLAATNASPLISIVAAKNFHDETSFRFYFGAHKQFTRVFDIDAFVPGDSALVYIAMNEALIAFFKANPGPFNAHVANHWALFHDGPVTKERTFIYFQPGVWEMEEVGKNPVLLKLYEARLKDVVVLANSDYMKSVLQERFGCEARVLYPCTDTEFFAQARAGSPSGKDIDVMMFSRLNPGKQFTEAIAIFEQIVERRPETKFTVAGAIRREDIAYLDDLRAEASKHGIESAVTFVPNPSLEDLRSLYQRAKLLLFLPKNEPLGLVPVEAMVSGVPVVAYDAGGVRETVVHGQTGYLCQDESDLVEYVAHLLDDESTLECFSSNANLVQEKFSEARFLEDLLTILS
jgi:glycosyltransferase involved in cell wall biosynthesis